jgi:hypothetical protein
VPYWGRWRLDVEGLDRIALPGDLRALVLRRIEGLGGQCAVRRRRISCR